jgi:nitrogenase molybdenum-iron protein alpha/beta subunit
MTSNPLRLNTSRFGGCTLTGALSVTTSVSGSVSIIHGPSGCAHHNFSLLHTTALEHDGLDTPQILSSGLLENEIIFGGEAALGRALDRAASLDPSCIFVLSTCIAETIGDDIGAACRMDRGVPVIQVPSGGFLGGVFEKGVNNALCTIADTAAPGTLDGTINIIGEKNLEYEVEENYAELFRLLSVLGLSVNVRFVHGISPQEVSGLGRASFNILRDPGVVPAGDHLKARFGTEYQPSFPVGLSGTLRFIRKVAAGCRVPSRAAVSAELAVQEDILAEFSDLSGVPVALNNVRVPSPAPAVAREVAAALAMKVSAGGCRVPVPFSPPIGTAGIRRMLHRWRRMINA